MSLPIVIIGCGGFGREVFSLVTALSEADESCWTVEGFADDAPSFENKRRVEALGAVLLSSVVALGQRAMPFSAVIAVGSPTTRQSIALRLVGAPAIFDVLVHPAATTGLRVHLGQGSVVAAGARLSTNIRLGQHVHVDQNVTIGHDTVVGDWVRINPHACISGDVAIGPGALIGANAVVLPGLQIGARAIVGAGACVVRDVLPGVTVKGVPAR